MATHYADCGAAFGAGEAQFRYANYYAQQAAPAASVYRPQWATILNVDPDASEQEIRHAYHLLAQENHPDHGGSEDAMKALNRAYAEALNFKKATVPCL